MDLLNNREAQVPHFNPENHKGMGLNPHPTPLNNNNNNNNPHMENNKNPLSPLHNNSKEDFKELNLNLPYHNTNPNKITNNDFD